MPCAQKTNSQNSASSLLKGPKSGSALLQYLVEWPYTAQFLQYGCVLIRMLLTLGSDPNHILLMTSSKFSDCEVFRDNLSHIDRCTLLFASNPDSSNDFKQQSSFISICSQECARSLCNVGGILIHVSSSYVCSESFSGRGDTKLYRSFCTVLH